MRSFNESKLFVICQDLLTELKRYYYVEWSCGVL